jgi:hypothetical protein
MQKTTRSSNCVCPDVMLDRARFLFYVGAGYNRSMSIAADLRLCAQADALLAEIARYRAQRPSGRDIVDGIPPSTFATNGHEPLEQGHGAAARHSPDSTSVEARNDDGRRPSRLRRRSDMSSLLTEYARAVSALGECQHEMEEAMQQSFRRSRELTETTLRASDELRTALTSELLRLQRVPGIHP